MATPECWTVAPMAVDMVGCTACRKFGGLDVVRIGEGKQEGRGVADVSPGLRPGSGTETPKEESVRAQHH